MTRSLELEAENEPFVKNGVAANLPSAKKSKFIVVVMFSLLALLALIHSSSETDTATTAIVLPCLLIKKMAWIIYPWGHLVHNVTHLPKNFKAT